MVCAIGITIAGAVLSGLTFGLGLATAVAELAAHGMHHLPADTGRLFAGSVIAATQVHSQAQIATWVTEHRLRRAPR